MRRTWLIAGLSWLVLVALTLRPGLVVGQQESSHDSEVASEPEVHASEDSTPHGEGTAAHGGHHDPYDKSTANASKDLENVAEFRSDLGIATVLVFALLLMVLWKFAWGPICEALEKREQGIANQLAEARASNEEAKRLLNDHQARLSRAAEEVRELLDQARRDGESMKQRLMTDAEQAASALKDRAVREIDAAKNGALEELARKSVEQAVNLAGRIVGKQLNASDHTQLIQEALQKMPSKN